MQKPDHERGLMNRYKPRIPEQATRLFFFLVVVIALLVSARSFLIPDDFGEFGHYRASAVEQEIANEIRFAGSAVCADCHDDFVEIKAGGFHRNVSCETCHGPAAAHVEDDEAIDLRLPRGRTYCPVCHEYLPSRPTGFPQIVSDSHNPLKPCIQCHQPHDPKPPETPKECSACHATISRTKMVSHHAYVECVQCHATPEEHKTDPREFLPRKPNSRSFCGSCHSDDSDGPLGVPTVDMISHGNGYVCWQCHYPHLPETQ